MGSGWIPLADGARIAGLAVPAFRHHVRVGHIAYRRKRREAWRVRKYPRPQRGRLFVKREDCERLRDEAARKRDAVAKARRLLAEGHMKPKEIARVCGLHESTPSAMLSRVRRQLEAQET